MSWSRDLHCNSFLIDILGAQPIGRYDLVVNQVMFWSRDTTENGSWACMHQGHAYSTYLYQYFDWQFVCVIGKFYACPAESPAAPGPRPLGFARPLCTCVQLASSLLCVDSWRRLHWCVVKSIGAFSAHFFFIWRSQLWLHFRIKYQPETGIK